MAETADERARHEATKEFDERTQHLRDNGQTVQADQAQAWRDAGNPR